jgi:hypothetical protein
VKSSDDSNDTRFVGFGGREFVVYHSTVQSRAQKHVDKSAMTMDEIIECVTNPDLVAKTSHTGAESMRNLYYKYGKPVAGAPPILRVVADHKDEPSPIVSWHRTSRTGGYSEIVYVEKPR